MAYNLRQKGDLATLDNSKLRQVDDFKYLGSWIDQTKKYVEFCEAKAWAASNKLTCSGVEIKPPQRSEDTFQCTGKTTSGCYTRLLSAALNVTWGDHTELYGNLLPISTSFQVRRQQFSGHC